VIVTSSNSILQELHPPTSTFENLTLKNSKLVSETPLLQEKLKTFVFNPWGLDLLLLLCQKIIPRDKNPYARNFRNVAFNISIMIKSNLIALNYALKTSRI